jgi:hypothetical protein
VTTVASKINEIINVKLTLFTPRYDFQK